MPVDTSWTFAPGILLALGSYGILYAAGWRRARRQGGARAAPGERAVLWASCWTKGICIERLES